MLPDQRLRAGGRHLLRGLPRFLSCGQVVHMLFFGGGGLILIALYGCFVVDSQAIID